MSIIIYSISIIITILLFINSFQIKELLAMQGRFGPRLFPQLVLILTFIAFSVLLYQEIYKNKESKKLEIFKNKNRLFQTMVLSLVFSILFTWLGGIASIFIFILAFSWIWKIRDFVHLVIFPALVTLGIYYVFHVFLSVRFPRGIIGNLF